MKQEIIKKLFAIFALQLCLFFAESNAKNTDIIPKVQIAYYEEIKDLTNHPEILLIDVRTPQELVQTGKIPTSINIPLSIIEKELSSDVNHGDFKNKYGRDKPLADAPLIFTCRSGKRAQQAAETAIKLGYKNVKNYMGSWLDWAEHEGLPKE